MTTGSKIIAILLVFDIASLVWVFIFGSSVYRSFETFFVHIIMGLCFGVVLASLLVASYINRHNSKT
jgi:uncharacterized membrane protein